MSLTKQVVIIGGGISGLKTFTTLQEHINPDKILIIEADNRLGGRLKSTNPKDSKLGISYDIGASWFHDSLNNILLDDLLAERVVGVDDVYYDDRDASVYDSTGEIDIVGLKLNRVLEDLEKFIEIYYHEDINRADMSLKDISEVFIKMHGLLLNGKQKEYAGRMIRYMELWYGIPYDLISGKYSIMDHQGRNLLNKETYSENLLKWIISKIPNSSIRLNDPVTSSKRGIKDGKRCSIKTKSGLVVNCDYLIVTVPLSKLQDDSINWSPPLPSNISTALNSIHFGALGKVIFEFQNIWWDNKQDRFQILPNKIESQVHEKLTIMPQPFTYPIFAVNFSKVHNINKGSLVILTQSPLTEYLESTTPENVWKYYKPMLQIIAISQIEDPINIITTNWTNNEFIKGSYSALHTHDDPSEIIIQLSNENEVPNIGLDDKYIRFCGEHTISDGAGCVHGAYMSGIREANYILKDLNIQF
ncbi:unnamed protein product [Candida verbasci]|uniref:Amine oxidase n=1 Tax=Candida verbasci TaxID=1227364 RepID=A0A9W4X8G8_9ASCO|nr:unnamed protein product [Candida verbasci]